MITKRDIILQAVVFVSNIVRCYFKRHIVVGQCWKKGPEECRIQCLTLDGNCTSNTSVMFFRVQSGTMHI